MEVAHIVDTLDRTTPVAPAALVPLGIAGYALPLATNVMATVFIVARLWAILGRAGREPVVGLYRSARSTGRTAVAIVVESGLLYLVTQLIFVVLFSMGHPAQAILAVIAVQVYVSTWHFLSSLSFQSIRLAGFAHLPDSFPSRASLRH